MDKNTENYLKASRHHRIISTLFTVFLVLFALALAIIKVVVHDKETLMTCLRITLLVNGILFGILGVYGLRTSNRDLMENQSIRKEHERKKNPEDLQ